MSIKGKSLKSLWVETEKDEYVLNISSNKGDSNTSWSLLKDESLSSQEDIPSISKGVFHAEITCKKSQVSKPPVDYMRVKVHIHPLTMEICQMKLSDPVLVCHSSQIFACNVWPSYEVAQGRAAFNEQVLHERNLKMGIFANIALPLNSAKPVQAIHFHPVKGFEGKKLKLLHSRHFLIYLNQYLDMCYVVVGQSVKVMYFGALFWLKVDSVNNTKRNNEAVPLSHIAEEEISSKFKQIKIESVSSHKTSTPTKSSMAFTNAPEVSDDANDISNCIYFPGSTQVYMVTQNTEIFINDLSLNDNISNEPVVKFFDIGGMEQQIADMKENVVNRFRKTSHISLTDLHPICGILLHGPPGTGKTLLATAAANEAGGRIKKLTREIILGSDAKLRCELKEAISQTPAIVILDRLDELCPYRKSAPVQSEQRLLDVINGFLNDIYARKSEVMVIATARNIDMIDPSLRGLGRFSKEIKITIPTAKERLKIFEKLLEKLKCSHDLTSEQLKSLSDYKCHGYVASDLYNVISAAVMNKLNEDKSSCVKLTLTMGDFECALLKTTSSAMEDLIVEIPKVYWKDIGGNERVKKELHHVIERPLKHPEAFERLGSVPSSGVLLYGPPGCSKTLTAKALATESGLNFILVQGPEIFNKYVGESERAIRHIFRKARAAAPSIIFIDEIDALAIERGSGGGNQVSDRIVTTLLMEMDGVEKKSGVIVVAATNRPDKIDKAFLRPGRIDVMLHVPLPNWEARREIFQIQFRKLRVSADVDIDSLVQRTEMYSGAEICSVCRKACKSAMDEDINIDSISSRHFTDALSSVLPQTTADVVRYYEEFERTINVSCLKAAVK